MIKEYGPVDEDLTAYKTLLSYLTEQGFTPLYIAHHKRKPLNSKRCQWPGSVRVQAVLPTGKVISSIQLTLGGDARIESS